MDEDLTSVAAAQTPDLSMLVIGLLKGVLYREGDERQWNALLSLQARIRDYLAVLQLELVLDEAEGYAFCKGRPDPAQDDRSPRLPRLVARRPLSFPVSLLLALLRKKLAEFDAGGGDTRLVLGRDDIVELVRMFLPDTANEARLIDGMEANINKVVELGFLHKLKGGPSGVTGPGTYEVKRILKAFVDAQWLSEFDAQLAAYHTMVSGPAAKDESEHG